MQLFYIDESGTGLADERSPFFVLSAVSIPVQHWHTVDSQVAALKRRLVGWAKPEDYEIKGRDIRRGERFFKNQSWGDRARAFQAIGQLIAELPVRVFSVQVDKRNLTEYVGSEADLYRLAFWRLLDELDLELRQGPDTGMVMLDMRSDLHSSVQDRRVIDAYREWLGSRGGPTRLVELPWFGFSAFYAGLQLADFSAYLIDFIHNEERPHRRADELAQAYDAFQSKVRLVRIP